MPACADRRLLENESIMRQIVIPFIAAALLSACANVDTKTEPREEKEIVTGSNIPRKDRSGVTVLPKEALEGLQRSSGGPTMK